MATDRLPLSHYPYPCPLAWHTYPDSVALCIVTPSTANTYRGHLPDGNLFSTRHDAMICLVPQARCGVLSVDNLLIVVYQVSGLLKRGIDGS